MSTKNSAVIVNDNGAIQIINAAGAVTAPGPDHTAQAVTVCQDGTIWIVSTETSTSGGNLIMCSTDDGKTFQTPGGNEYGAVKIAGLLDGTCWYLDGDHALHLVTQAGVSTPIEYEGKIMDIKTDIHQVGWIISTNFNPVLEGNTIMNRDTNYPTFNPIKGDPVGVKISPFQGSTCLAITPSGAIHSIVYDGTIKEVQAAVATDIPVDISASQEGGAIWILTGVRENSGGLPVSVWVYEDGKAPVWTVVPNILAISIAGAG
ncbi:MAG: hypothetical protein ACI837_002345 [Crocinitomicaceae bacterium]|jgi:hypothetical protein